MSKQIKHNGSTVRRVLKLIRPYAGLVALTLTLAAVTVFTTLLAPVLSGKAVDLIVGPGQVDFAGLAKTGRGHRRHHPLHRRGPVADERGQQPHHLPGGAGHAHPGFPADGDPAAEIYGRSPSRRCHQPDHHRRGTVQ